MNNGKVLISLNLPLWLYALYVQFMDQHYLPLPLSLPPSHPPSLGTGSPRRQRQRKTLEQQTAISPPQVSGSSQSGLDSVSLQSASSGGSGRDNVEEKGLMNDGNVVTKELNGEVRSMPISHSYTETLNEEVPCTVFM